MTTQSPADAPGANALVAGTPVAVDAAARTVTLTLPARSVSSIVVDGVSGVADSAALLPDGGTVQLVGVQSGKALTATSGTAATTLTTPGTTAAAASAQVWTVHEVPGTGATRESTRRVVLTDPQGRVLGATSAGTDLRTVTVEAAAAGPATRWILSTTDGSTFALVNQGLGTALDVGGQSTSENATVGVYTSNGGTNQLWRARSTQAAGSRPVTLATVAGVVPTLPSTVVPTYAWGTGVPAPVTWQLPGEDVWATTGQVVVHGTATDVYGGTVEAVATVDVGGYTVTDPVSVTTFAGASLASVQAVAPATVPARVGASTATFDAAVAWDFAALTDADLTDVGTVTVPGTATSNDPAAAPLPATLTVILTARSTSNIATLPTTTASATFTESSAYSVDRTRNGDRTDKGWSNWKGSNKNTSDTLTYTFGGARQLSEATIWFSKDGSSTSWAQSMQVQVRDAAGTWVSVPGYETAVPVTSPADGSAPVVTVPLGGVDATAVRFVLNAYANTHLIVSEVEVQASGPAAASVATLGALRLDGTSVPGFDPAVTDYSVDVDGAAFPALAAVPTDDDATVRLTQPTAANGGVGTVRVTAADGTTTATTTVTVVRHATVGTAEVLGTAKVGQTVTAQVTTDPADATVALTWLADGQAIAGATGSTLVVPASAGGKALTVRAVASADGLVDGTGESAPVTVQPLSSDARLATLTLDGTTVEGFDPATTRYTVLSAGSAWPTLAAATADPTATVRIVQPVDGRGTGTVTVTAEDGTRLVYRVVVQRQVAVTAVDLRGTGRVGTRVTAVVQSDPGRVQLTYSWAVDGRTVRGAHQATYVPRPSDAGKALTVTVTASARGYLTSDARASTSLVVTAHHGGCPWSWF
ncbi:RICIN domain-containing protein [Cellulomonas soli]